MPPSTSGKMPDATLEATLSLNPFDRLRVSVNVPAKITHNMKTSVIAFGAILLTAGVSTVHAADDAWMDPAKLPPVSALKDVTYAKDIKPLFEKSCLKCHDADKPKAKLRLDSLEAALKGGKNGKDIIPGKSGKSPMAYAVARIGEDEDAYMPPPKEESKLDPLTKEQVGLIRAWIDQGAK
jgi:Planctomycete cytochrome C